MTTSETDTAIWEARQRASATQKRADTRKWIKNFVLVAALIALKLAVVAMFGAGAPV